MSSVDVIIPCYRYAQYLRNCVDSVLTQDVAALRVLIIDDESPDNTADVASELAQHDRRVTFLRHIKNKGHIHTYNEGIEWASSDYLLLLSADDYLLPGALHRAVTLMDAHPDVGFTFGSVIQLYADGATQTVPLPFGISSETPWSIMSGLEFIQRSGSSNVVSTPSVVVRTELQKRLGGYRSELPHSGDMEMWFRLAAHGSVGMIAAAQAVYRIHSANMSRAYMTRGWLPDLEQREAAIRFFIQTCESVLPEVGRLQQKILYSLSCDAVSFASTAFNVGEMSISDKLAAYAQRLNPAIRRSLPWLRFTCKRRLGLRTWRALGPLFDTIRTFQAPAETVTRQRVNTN